MYKMDTIRKELLVFFFYVLLTFVTASMAGWYVWNSQDDTLPALYDVMFKILPDWSHVEFPVPNVVFITQAVLAIIGIEEPKYRYICQMVFLNSTLLFIRSFTTSSTHMPNIHTYDYCKERPDTYFRVVWLMISKGTCADFMYSGHTVTSFLLYLFTHRHATNYAYEFTSGIFLGGTIFSLLVFRWHYTSDILIALVITWLIFKLYKENEDNNNMWFYFNSLKKLNWRCQRTTRNERTNFSRGVEPVS